MTDATPNPAASTAPSTKRHPAERFLVWGGILVLLALLGWEWSARNGYERSMHDVEEAVRTAGDKELTPEDTKKYVHGYAVWGETTHLNSRLITLKWPSLFKKYQFNMALDGNGVVRGVETELPVADAMDPWCTQWKLRRCPQLDPRPPSTR